MSKRSKHTKSDIESALVHAEKNGWIIKINKNGHAWGTMLCPFNNENCRCGMYCRRSIWSTPRNPRDHADDLRNAVDKCICLSQSNKEND
jgi:hypothetical protein